MIAMPWTASDAKSHNKAADTPAKQKKWATVANAALKTYKGDEGKAIAAANDAIGRSLAASIPSVPEDDDDKTTGKSKVQEARGPKKKSDDDDEAKDDASPDDDAGTEASTDEEDDEDKKKRKDDDDGTEAVADEDQTGASEVIALENAPASDDDQSNADLSEEQKKAGKKFRPRRDPMTEIRYRKMGVISLAPNSFNPETREVDAVVSTGMKVRRRDWDGEYDEVLEMSSKACNLGRMNAGAAVLDSHQWHNGIQSMLGSVVPGSARIDKGELVARVRFSRGSALAKRVLQDL